MKQLLVSIIVLIGFTVFAQAQSDSTDVYKKRVLENIEVNILSSYYSQTGNNASVSGGIGSEELTNSPVNIAVLVPLNDDGYLSIDAGVSAYTSASSSNLNPFDGSGPADPFVASSGASRADQLTSLNVAYSHSSDDRNTIISGNLSASAEYDYSSIGFGGSITKLFNEKNTSLSFNANVFLDQWDVLYPYELGGDAGDDDDETPFNINNFTTTGNPNYSHVFTPFSTTSRNSYAFGAGFSQIISKNLQGALSLDVILQDGLLANHMQRVYFSDVDNTFIENFHLADDVERLPSSRLKTAIGGRLHYYINEIFVLRSSYRFYFDDWGITSHTIGIEVPIKPFYGLTLYPSYRFYNQSAADYFAPYDQHLSTSEFYTSDYDLSKYNAHQYGFGISYTDIFTKLHIGKFGFKSIDVKYDYYQRNTGLKANIITLGLKFLIQ